MTADWCWIEKSPMLDGSGVIELGGQQYKIVCVQIVNRPHRIALLDGEEVACASKFTTLLRKLRRQSPASGNEQEQP